MTVSLMERALIVLRVALLQGNLCPPSLRQRFDLDVAKRHWVVMPAEAEVSRQAILARMWFATHELRYLAQVAVEDTSAVQLDADGVALHGHLHEVPLADRPKVATFRRNHPVGRAVVLPRIELGVLR